MFWIGFEKRASGKAEHYYFHADWATPCKSFRPRLEALSKDHHHVDVDTKEGGALASRYGVRGIPAVVKVRHGKAVGHLIGNQPDENIKAFLSGHEKQAADCAELKYLMKKHEERETPSQEEAESPKEQQLERELGVEKQARVLTARSRNNLPGEDFVFPGDRRYPIHDAAHARNALARSAGKPEAAKVRAAVHRKFPDIGAE